MTVFWAIAALLAFLLLLRIAIALEIIARNHERLLHHAMRYANHIETRNGAAANERAAARRAQSADGGDDG